MENNLSSLIDILYQVAHIGVLLFFLAFLVLIITLFWLAGFAILEEFLKRK